LPPSLAALIQIDRLGCLEDVDCCTLEIFGHPRREQITAAPHAFRVGVPILVRHEEITQAGAEALVFGRSG